MVVLMVIGEMPIEEMTENQIILEITVEVTEEGMIRVQRRKKTDIGRGRGRGHSRLVLVAIEEEDMVIRVVEVAKHLIRHVDDRSNGTGRVAYTHASAETETKGVCFFSEPSFNYVHVSKNGQVSTQTTEDSKHENERLEDQDNPWNKAKPRYEKESCC
ncbi:hypothetical protein FNV43_RR23007 [Rhamnella rubrinervis]|uniref:Uncharacterized protein n=1 Tax=Rhamnella rubrinervis TaxID=2594499 RepID=A0A8K0DY49_9ROSA|nr:hypothetical protein FNV43_RR23007 [Rhamnella rubrinervis]